MYTGMRVIFGLMLAGFLLTGCASKTKDVKPEFGYIGNVSTTQRHDGLVTISWPSRKGRIYQMVVWDRPRVIPDRKLYEGTGEDIVVQFMLDPSIPLPEYKVREKLGNY